jgi:transposase-like protein
MSAEETLRILEEARASNTTVAKVLRRHQLDAATFYRWERDAKAGSGMATGPPHSSSSTPQQRVIQQRRELGIACHLVSNRRKTPDRPQQPLGSLVSFTGPQCRPGGRQPDVASAALAQFTRPVE